MIWGWQERVRDHGAAALWRDKTRPSRIPPLSPEMAERVVALTLAGPPPAACSACGVGINIDTNRLGKTTEEIQKAIEKIPPEISIKFFR